MKLRIYPVGAAAGDRKRAERILDGLAERRPVAESEHHREVAYGTDDRSEAMRMCADELSGLDPDWFVILDFGALAPSRRRLGSVGRHDSRPIRRRSVRRT